MIPGPTCCSGCGSVRPSKLGEDTTETLEVIPRQWKVIETVRERFACRACETISQPPAPFHVTPRGVFGASLLAMILFEKFGQHQRDYRKFRVLGGLEGKKEPYYVTPQSPIDIQ